MKQGLGLFCLRSKNETGRDGIYDYQDVFMSFHDKLNTFRTNFIESLTSVLYTPIND